MMNTLIFKDEDGITQVTSDDGILAAALKSLEHNNTFCPNITLVKKGLVKTTKRGPHGEKMKDENGKCIKVDKPQMTVYFADGTWTNVTLSDQDNDKADDLLALSFAINKRIMGTPTPTGYVTGNGYMSRMQRILDSVVTPESEKKAAQERKAKKEAEDKKAHEDAMERKCSNPSLGSRLHSLEDKFEKLMDKLSK